MLRSLQNLSTLTWYHSPDILHISESADANLSISLSYSLYHSELARLPSCGILQGVFLHILASYSLHHCMLSSLGLLPWNVWIQYIPCEDQSRLPRLNFHLTSDLVPLLV